MPETKRSAMLRNSEKPLMVAAAILMLLSLLSLTGCSPTRYVMIDGEETVTVKKTTIEKLYSSNERLTAALKRCQLERGEP